MAVHHLGNGSLANHGKLAWRPPNLINPLTIKLTNSDSGRKAIMNPTRDYIIDARGVTLTVDEGIEVNGGRNVILIGAEVRFDTDNGPDDSLLNRVLFIKGNAAQTIPRTVHIEGLKASGYLREGINIDGQGEPGLNVQLQNINFVDELLGSEATNHSDFLQVYNGPTNLRLDRCYGKVGYQALMLQPRQFGTSPLQLYSFTRCYFEGTATSGPMFYLVTGSSASERPLVGTRDVWLKPNPTKDYPSEVIYEDPALWGGGIRLARDGRNSFVSSVPGRHYVSPGYEN